MTGINTVERTRLNLMSMTEFFETWGFDTSMSHTGFTGFHKIDPTTNELVQISFFHNPRRHCWNMITVVAADMDGAKADGEIIESIYPRLTYDMIRSALTFEANATSSDASSPDHEIAAMSNLN
eukprot:SAG31_NODE_5014_length_2801_cov_5.313101_1_plen_124_part_00